MSFTDLYREHAETRTDPPPGPTEDEERRERLVQYEEERLDAQAKARARLAARGFEAPTFYPTLVEQFAREREPVLQRVAGLMDVGSNVLVQAKQKTGKATTTANLVQCLADDEPFLGELAVIPPDGRVGLINYEMTIDKMDDWLQDVGIKHPERVSALNLRGHRMPLVAAPVQEFLIAWARDQRIETLLLDPWGRAMSGSGSENSNDDVRVVLEILGEIKRRAQILDLVVLAHISAADVEIGRERVRGASELLGWPDSIVTLTADDEGTRYLSAVGRDIDFPERALTYNAATRRLTLSVELGDRKVAANRAAAEKVARAVESGPLPVGRTEAALHAFGIKHKPDKAAAIEAAVTLKLVHRAPNPRNANSTLIVHGPWTP